ncbi:MAG: Na+:solute symporter, partial [Saprospiraceae bacterium]|nr:Na+:solute symporter [Saprospiraceae bacterium]
LDTFNILLQIGAGTGLIFIMRWFWWRINAWSEITAMLVSFVIALVFHFGFNGNAVFEDWEKLVLGVAITTVAWVVVTLMTRPTNMETLRTFFLLIKPHKNGWKPVVQQLEKEAGMETYLKGTGKLPTQILSMFLGVFLVYSALFATGYFIYGDFTNGIIGLAVALVSSLGLIRFWKKM